MSHSSDRPAPGNPRPKGDARRRFLRTSAGMLGGAGVAGCAAPGSVAAPAAAGDVRRAGIRRIATEEAFVTPEVVQATNAYMSSPAAVDEPGLAVNRRIVSQQTAAFWGQRLTNFGDLRRAEMDRAGIDMQVLLMGSPGVQIFPPDQGTALARQANDRVAVMCRAEPTRYAALATLAPQAPRQAADEFSRAVRDLGFRGALINSSTKGEYLDDPKFWPIFETAQALDLPIYLHPREPSPAMVKPFGDARLTGSIWGFAAETGLHALRLILAGVFDNFPRLQIILGHAGESLPFFADRIDLRFGIEVLPGGGKPLKRKPSDYLRDNFIITTSGMNWEQPTRLCISFMGADRVLFAADWPFEDADEAVRSFDAIRLTDDERRKLYQTNAERVFKLR